MFNSSAYAGSNEKLSPFEFSVVLLISISHSFTCLLSVSVCAKTLARNANVSTIYCRFTMYCCSTKEAQNLKLLYNSLVIVLVQATAPVIVHFPESVVQTAGGASYMLMVVFGSLLGILGLIIILLILYIYKQ